MTFYELIKGHVGIYISYGTDNQTRLTELGGGAVFGEMAVVESAPRSATAVAEEDVTVLEIIGNNMIEFLKEYPEKAVSIMSHMSARLRGLTEDYISACGTIREMEQSENEKRSEGLIARIKRYIRDYDDSQKVLARGYLYDVNLHY